jgi:ubiquinone/menaquinone biosynthesis C-methylase UbiE
MTAAANVNLDPYALVTDFYDRWTAHMTADIGFYVECARESSTPVVELGVGTGRVAIPMARAGATVVGVDTSSAMMTEGARRAAEAGVGERISWVQGDMRTFVADEPADLVVCPFRSFLHLLTTEDQLAALQAVRASLRPGGRFVTNFFTPDPLTMVQLEGKRVLSNTFTDERGRTCEIWDVTRYELSTQVVTLTAELLVYEGRRLVASTDSTLRLRMVYRYEFDHLLARAGLDLVALYGDFDGKAYGPGTDEMIWIARKP